MDKNRVMESVDYYVIASAYRSEPGIKEILSSTRKFSQYEEAYNVSEETVFDDEGYGIYGIDESGKVYDLTYPNHPSLAYYKSNLAISPMSSHNQTDFFLD